MSPARGGRVAWLVGAARGRHPGAVRTHLAPRRPARRLLLVAAAGAALLLGACGGAGTASKGDVEDDVADALADEGFRSSPDADPIPLTRGQATDAAECIATTLFDGETFTKDERTDVVSGGDGTAPDPELAARVQTLVSDCVGRVLAAGPVAPDDED